MRIPGGESVWSETAGNNRNKGGIGDAAWAHACVVQPPYDGPGAQLVAVAVAFGVIVPGKE